MNQTKAKRRINVVFQGGGVRGIAHVGAYKAVEAQKDIEVVGVGGSSVGSIIASLLAAGYDAEEIKAEMKRRPLHTLLGPRTTNVRQISADIKGLLGAVERALHTYEKPFGTFRVLSHVNQLVGRIRESSAIATDVLSDYGLYDIREITGWLRELLGKKGIVWIGDLTTKGKLQIKRFRLVVSDVTHCCYREITEKDVREEVVNTVAQSISIPIVFKPFKVGESYFVDGGMLSNYPLWLFQDTEDPTVGIRLRSHQDMKLSYPVDNFFDYMLALLWTMVGAHDKFRGIPSDCYPLDIPTGDIGATEFDLDEKVDRLLTDGELCATQFHWDQVRPKKKIPFKEIHAEEILYEALESASDIFFFGGVTKRFFPRYEITVKIEKDGTTIHEVEYEIRNVGETPISHSARSASDLKVPLSFKDLRFDVGDITPSKSKDQRVRYLPYKNTLDEKGILIFYVPPIMPGEGRTIQVSYTSPEEYKTTLLQGDPEEGAFDLTTLPGHEARYEKIIYRLLLDRDLGELTCREKIPGGVSFTPDAGLSRYREYRWEFVDVDPWGKFRVEFRLSSYGS